MNGVSQVPRAHSPHNEYRYKFLWLAVGVRSALGKIEGTIGERDIKGSSLTTEIFFAQGNPPLNFPGKYPTT